MIKTGKIIRVFDKKALVRFNDNTQDVLLRGKFKVGQVVKLNVDVLRTKDKDIILSVKPWGGVLERSVSKAGKHERVTGTLCSQSKYKVPKAVPEELWDSNRIRKYFKFCDQYGLPSSIVSWKYGIVPREVEVFNYDEFNTGNEKHWLDVFRRAREKYGVKELYMWFDPGRSLSPVILRAAEKVFKKSGGTRHLYNLMRYVEEAKVRMYEMDGVEHIINSWVAPRSRVIVVNSDDFSLVHYLTNVKYCKCVVYDYRKWAKEIQKAAIKRERMPKRLPDNIEELLKFKNLTVKAAAIAYLIEKNKEEVDLDRVRKLGEEILKAGRYKRVEIRHVFPKVTKNDVVLIQEPQTYPVLEKYFQSKENKFNWEEVLFALGKKVPSQVLIVRKNKLREVNTFYRITGDFFSDRSVLTYKDYVVYKCS